MALGSQILPEGVDACCIACSSPLYFIPDSYPLSFHCRNGHYLTLTDLLDDLLSTRKKHTPSTLDCWRARACLLHELAKRALQSGHAFAAADYQDAANRLDQWVTKLRALLPRAPRQTRHSG